MFNADKYKGIIGDENLAKLKSIWGRSDNSTLAEINQRVVAILEDIKLNGDEALKKYSQKFDNYSGALLVPASSGGIGDSAEKSLRRAFQRIRRFHEIEFKKSNYQKGWSFKSDSGESLGVRYSPLDSVAVYVPGGKAPLVSTVLMTVIPAKVAGVKRIVLFSPPPIHPAILFAAQLAGVDEIYAIGGAQAIAAAAYGTESIEPVDKIVGPGNIYVTLAKKNVFGHVGIDGVFGPSELAIIADSSADLGFVALDLLTQLEHGSGLESVLLIAPNQQFIDAVQLRIEQELEDLLAKSLKTKDQVTVIRNSIQNNSAFLVAISVQEISAIVNLYAPEHLELQVDSKLEKQLFKSINKAGAIFVGDKSCESLGDYLAGPSHCLPTARAARFSSGLQVVDFLTKSSVLDFSSVNKTKFKSLIRDVVNLARLENLELHARAMELRDDS